MELLGLLSAATLGFLACNIATHPRSKVRQKMPRVKVKNLQILPEVSIHVRGKIVHFHHWFNFSIILIISFFVSSSILDAMFTRGFLIGGIIQGLRFPDRKLIFNEIEKLQASWNRKS